MNHLERCPCCHTPVRPLETTCAACGCSLGVDDDAVGRLLRNGALQIQRRLGRGGMGSLYLAEYTSSGEPCVVKELRLPTNRAVWSTLELMFQEEAQLLARLSTEHLAVPRFRDSFMDSGAFYIVIEFVPGQNLEEYVHQQGGPLPVPEVIEYGGQAVDVLVHLHELTPHPVIHGDLKPSNLIRQPDGRIVVIDFGLSRLNQPMPSYVPSHGSAFGTPGYSPMEQWEGRVTGASDVFALGATLHYLITGRNPRAAFAGLSQLSRSDLSRLTTFPPIAGLTPEVPPSLDLLVGEMVRRRATERPTMREVQSRLARVGAWLVT